MTPNWTKRFLTFALTLTATGVLSSCVMDDVGLINRQDPDQVPKALFEGEWIFGQTTIDAPYSTAATFAGHLNFGDAAKVIFDVQENFLVAYPVVETVDGTEEGYKTNHIRKYWSDDPEERAEFIEMYTGQPLAMWQITSHFDLNRSYNTYNGAQSNELVENTSDQPWYKRSHIRVNWHSNSIRPFFMPLGGGVKSSSYYVGDQDPNHPDALTVDVEGGYLDYVVRTDVNSYGSYYCSIYGLSPYDCAYAEVKLRHSFKRLDPKRDYEPLRYHNKEHQDKFGYFLTERPHYDLDYGSSYVGKLSFINRHNLWTNNFDFEYATNADGSEIACMSDIECDEEAGFRCQKDTSDFEPGNCALPIPRPYRQRTSKPIIYHLNAEWHPDYLESAYLAADEWNDVFRDAASWRLFYEELGQSHVRGCTTNDECATDDFGNSLVLEDRDVVVTQEGIPCHSETECGNAFCGAAGVCATERSCGAGVACALGQTCQGGICMEGGEVAEQSVEGVSLRGSTLVYHTGGSVLTHDNFSSSKLAELPAGSAFVRFIHAAPEAGALGLTVGSTSIAGGDYDADRDYDPQDPATADFMAAVPAGTGMSFTVTADGSALDDAVSGDLVAGNSYVVVYNGEDVVIYGVSFADSQRGIRLIHAAAGEGKVDFGVAGVRTDKGVGYRQSTLYQNISGYIQRVTISREKSRGDLTCYVDNAIGRCVGWSKELNEADLARQVEIKANLPDLFVLCQNQYDDVDATGDTSSHNKEHYGDARYTYTKDGALYNPCGDPILVANPTEPKKLGDVRYSTFNWVNDAQRSGPLGYGPSIADPETGEIIAGFSNLYGGAVHTYGQWAADLLAMVNGDIDTANVVTGDFVREAMKDREKDSDPHLATRFGGLANANPGRTQKHPVMQRFDKTPKLDHHDLHAHGLGHPHLATDLQARPELMGAPSKPVSDYQFEELNEILRHPEAFAADLQSQLPSLDANFYKDRLAKLKGTPVEAMMMNNEVLRTAPFVARGEGITNMNLIGLPFDGEPLSEAQITEQLSPTHWASKQSLRSEEERVRFLARNNMYMGEFIDDALWGLAKELKDQGLSYDEIRLKVSQLILQGVLEHEVGHTVGLRHNFSGSTDVFNFHDEYYDVREKEVILCQDDGWCDELTGEVCAYEDCNADSDCITGMLCVANQCSAPAKDDGTELIPTGICSRPVGDSPCTTDSQCDSDAAQVCVNGECFEPNEQFVPRVWLTDNERAGKRTQYQYTTTMDYGGRFNSDIQGLGKYDYAAIRFGYSQLVDTYADTSRLRGRVEQAAQITGSANTQYSYFMNTRWWPSRGVGFWHPFNYLNNYIGVEENLKRVPRPYEQVKYQHAMVSNDVREYIDFEDIEVPYAFCSDEYRGNMGCYYFDVGIDAGEMGRHARDQLEQYYIFDAFKRERLYFGRYGSAMSYFGRIMDRYLRVLGDVGMYYALWETYLFRYSWYDSWKDSPMGGRTLERAAMDTFGHLMDAVASPAPGSYVYDEQKDAYVNTNLAEGVEGSEFNIPLGVGRYPYTQYGQSLGYTYQEHPLWFGAFWEKIAALLTLTDSTAYFVNQFVGEQVVGGGTSLGFNTVFSDEMNLFLGSVISDQMDLYAGRVNQDKYAPPSLAGDLDHDNTVAVEPSLNNFTLKLYAAVFGLAYLPAGFDPRFIDATAVFLEGEATQYAHANEPGVIEHRFEDPIGGKVYLAYSNNYGEYDQTKISAGATMVERGSDLADEWADATGTEKEQVGLRIQETREVLDVLRDLNQIYSASLLGL